MKKQLSFVMFIVIAHCAYANALLALPPRPQNASPEEMAAYIAAVKEALLTQRPSGVAAAAPLTKSKSVSTFAEASADTAPSFNKSYYLLMRLAQEVMRLDDNQDSPLVQLNNALNAGNDVDMSAEASAKVDDDMINAALQYIESWVAEQGDSLPAYQAARINRMLDMVSAMINSDFLKSQNIESSLRARPELVEGCLRALEENPSTRSGRAREEVNSDWDDNDNDSEEADKSSTLKIKRKTKFYKDVTFKDKAHFDHFVGLHGNAHFHKNVEIDGNLSVADEIVGCDLTVGCNLSMSDSISPEIGNVIKNGNPFIHTYPGSASQNTFVGENAGNFSITSGQNTALGNGAMQNSNASNDVAIGVLALLADQGFDNIAVGDFALVSNTTGSFNIAIGTAALASNTKGIANTAVGDTACVFNTRGNINTAIGSSALLSNDSGSGNVGIGAGALQNNITGGSNVAIGTFSMGGGSAALGSNNTAVGFASFGSGSGDNNIAIGIHALEDSFFGSDNIAIGSYAMLFGTGSNNTTIGNNALGGAQGNSNIAIGDQAGSALTSTESDNIYIGNDGVAGDNGIIRIGTLLTHEETYIQGIFGTAIVGSTMPVETNIFGQLGTVVSSKRFKQNIADMATDSELIYDLRPVSFSYISDEESTKQYGLIAEEVAEIFPSLVVYDRDEQPLSVRYQVLPILLLNEVQKQHEVIDQQGVMIAQQGEVISDIKNRLVALEMNN